MSWRLEAKGCNFDTKRRLGVAAMLGQEGAAELARPRVGYSQITSEWKVCKREKNKLFARWSWL